MALYETKDKEKKEVGEDKTIKRQEKKNLNHFCIQSKDQDEQIDLIDHS